MSLPYHNPFTLAGRMMQLDYQTRGRAMFGVGPGSLVYDADKMGLAAADQRRKLDEALDVIMELMAGRMVTHKTDWFDLREARLQLKSYSQPMMEMAVASARSPTGALQAGKHGIGMISLGGTSDDALKAHAATWGVYHLMGGDLGVTIGRKLALVFVPIAAGVVVYLTLARLLGMDEARLLLRRRHDHRGVPGPDQKDVPPPG